MDRILKFYIAILLIFLSGNISCFAQKTIVLEKDQSFYSIESQAYYLEDADKSLRFEDIINPNYQEEFKPSPNGKLNFGYSYSAYWLKLQVENKSDTVDKWFIEFDYPLLDEIEFWFQENSGEWKCIKTGDLYPFYERAVIYKNCILPLPFQNHKIQTFYIKVNTQSASQIPLFILNAKYLDQEKITVQMAYGLFFGIMITMLLYNLMIFFSLGDRAYFYYVLATLSNIFLYASLSGYSFQYIFFDSPYWANQVVLISLNCTSLFLHFFSISFLNTKKYAAWVFYIQWGLIILSAISILLSFVLPYLLMGRISIFIATITAFLVLFISFYSWIKGNRASRFFVLAFTFYLIGSILVIFKNLGILPANFINTHAIEIGSALEVILLSLALADKYRIYKAEKEKIQKEANNTLEAQVQKRTLQLKEANEELQQLNEELSTTLSHANFLKEKIQQKNEDIMDSIRYAQMIQKSILEFDQSVTGFFSDYFIFYRPKDVVSGDFFKIVEFNDKIIVAVFDCTGHGVPGAMMSMVGNSIFQQIIEQKLITEPHLILKHIHEQISKILHQKDTSNKDGMDATICSIDKKTGVIEFAGAMSSMICIQEKINQDRQRYIELNTLKGDKLSIGGEQEGVQKNFNKQAIITQSAQEEEIISTWLYLFSDGYQDQFGGPYRKKFMSKQLRTVLLNIHQKPMQAQQQILEETLGTWMGEEAQVDDILILGIKL